MVRTLQRIAHIYTPQTPPHHIHNTVSLSPRCVTDTTTSHSPSRRTQDHVLYTNHHITQLHRNPYSYLSHTPHRRNHHRHRRITYSTAPHTPMVRTLQRITHIYHHKLHHTTFTTLCHLVHAVSQTPLHRTL